MCDQYTGVNNGNRGNEPLLAPYSYRGNQASSGADGSSGNGKNTKGFTVFVRESVEAVQLDTTNLTSTTIETTEIKSSNTETATLFVTGNANIRDLYVPGTLQVTNVGGFTLNGAPLDFNNQLSTNINQSGGTIVALTQLNSEKIACGLNLTSPLIPEAYLHVRGTDNSTGGILIDSSANNIHRLGIYPTDTNSVAFQKLSALGNINFLNNIGTIDVQINSAGDLVANNNIIIDNMKRLEFRESNNNGTQSFTFNAPSSLLSDVNLTLPSTQGTIDQVMRNDGTGLLGWANYAIDGGNSIGTPLTIGTNDVQSLILETGGVNRIIVGSTGNVSIDGAVNINGGINVSGDAVIHDATMYNAMVRNIVMYGSLIGNTFSTTFDRVSGGSSHTLTWPNLQGTMGSILTNDGNGTMSWSTNINVPIISTTNITTDTVILNNGGVSTTLNRNFGGSSHTLTFPNNQGGASTVLTNDGSGGLSWSTSGIGSDISVTNITTDKVILNNGGVSTILSRTAGGSSHTLTWPNSQGGVSTVLKNNGSGILTWGTAIIGSDTNGNTIGGSFSGTSLTSGYSNTIFGASSGTLLTTGNSNIIIGTSSGTVLNTGTDNIIIGVNSGITCNSGKNILIGRSVGSNTNSLDNILIGTNTNGGTSTGRNVCIGDSSGNKITTGGSNSLFGCSAGYEITSGSANISIGYVSAYNLNTGNENICIGHLSGFGLTSGSYNTFIGYNSSTLNGSITNSIAIGKEATCTTSDQCVIGNASLNMIRPMSDGVCNLGTKGFKFNDLYTENVKLYGETGTIGTFFTRAINGTEHTLVWPNSQGLASTVLMNDGSGGLSWSTSGIGSDISVTNITTDNVILNNGGVSTTLSRTVGGSSHTLTFPNTQGGASTVLINDGNGTLSWGAVVATTIGSDAYFNTKGGVLAGNALTIGNSNTIFGASSGTVITTGSYNSIYGVEAGKSIIGGGGNCIFGYQAGKFNISGINNVLLGGGAGYLTEGSYNTCIGLYSGQNIVNGSYNTIIGSNSNVDNANAVNRIAIGYNIVATQDNGFFTTLRGTVAGTNVVKYDSVTKELTYDNPSSIKFKQDVNIYIPDDNFQNIRPVTYRYKSDTTDLQFGFIAEELYEQYPEFVILGQSEKDVEFYKKPYNVDYIKMCVLLVHEVQKLRANKRDQDREIAELKTRMTTTEESIRQILAQIPPLVSSS
jgi:hypothetical protein